ncbi:MAG: hypothetical protein HZA62_03705 [Rhodocyclales bacterium]|nr:hypothetical protein [Rhodocyclales bacterium]
MIELLFVYRKTNGPVKGCSGKLALMKPLRSKAVEQRTLSSPLRMAVRRAGPSPAWGRRYFSGGRGTKPAT